MKMLESEGFAFDCYIDIFDGGPTMTCATDRIRTVRESSMLTLAAVEEPPNDSEWPIMLLAAGRLGGFRACCTAVKVAPDETAVMSRESAALLEIEPGQTFLAMGR